MTDQNDIGSYIDIDIIKIKQDKILQEKQSVATEMPFTIIANDVELATLLCSPTQLKELTIGFLSTSGFIKSSKEILSHTIDTTNWVAYVELTREINIDFTRKRLYTTGCGRGVMYSSITEISTRHPIQDIITIHKDQIIELARWLQHCSQLYRTTGAVHTAALSENGMIPRFYSDDIGRHNAVDKVIGKSLMEDINLSRTILISSGRISSEILHKVKISDIPITISRGAPTHQTILRALEMGVTVVGFARGGGFTIYSHEERITF